MSSTAGPSACARCRRTGSAAAKERASPFLSWHRAPAIETIEVYTTRPDTLFGMSFVALAPEHPLAAAVAARDPGASSFIAECRRLGTSEAAIEAAEKQGYDTGLTVAHPFLKGEKIPVWIANFVLMEYGTGAIFGCPAHDQRDLEFARKYGLPVLPVVLPPGERAEDFAIGATAWTGPGTIIRSDFLDGLDPAGAKRRVIAELERIGVGRGEVNWRLRDWGVSRQRYWGCPIPVIHCASCGIVPVPERDLPVLLPEDVRFDRPGNPLADHPTLEARSLPVLRRAGRARDRHARYVRRQRLVFFPLLQPARGRPGRSRARSITGCRSISISAASSTRSCICSMRASSPARCGRRASLRLTSRSPGSSRRAW